jgi:bifunctional ADP-heptose synthase (sugar kinase/adenylyltransferase)
VIAVLGLILASNKNLELSQLIEYGVFIANIAAGIVVSKFGTATVNIDEIIAALDILNES